VYGGDLIAKGSRSAKLSVHDLRHHFASRLVQSGVPLDTVRDLLAHADTAMVLRYAHLSPDHLAEAVEKVARSKDGQATLQAGSCHKDFRENDGAGGKARRASCHTDCP
jgi:hypothetical protein